jgi:hypothetical protein
MGDAAATAHAVHALVTALPADRRPARDNGRLVFAAPWEARALGLAAALRAAGVDPAPALTEGLGTVDADADPSAYWARWLDALVDLAAASGVTAADLAARTVDLAAHDDHDH